MLRIFCGSEVFPINKKTPTCDKGNSASINVGHVFLYFNKF